LLRNVSEVSEKNGGFVQLYRDAAELAGILLWSWDAIPDA